MLLAQTLSIRRTAGAGLQVLDTLALNCSPAIRGQLAGKHFLQRAASLAGDKRQGACSEAAVQLLVDWAFVYKRASLALLPRCSVWTACLLQSGMQAASGRCLTSVGDEVSGTDHVTLSAVQHGGAGQGSFGGNAAAVPAPASPATTQPARLRPGAAWQRIADCSTCYVLSVPLWCQAVNSGLAASSAHRACYDHATVHYALLPRQSIGFAHGLSP